MLLRRPNNVEELMSPISQGLKQFKIFWLYLTSSNTQSVLLPWNFSWDNLAALYVDMPWKPRQLSLWNISLPKYWPSLICQITAKLRYLNGGDIFSDASTAAARRYLGVCMLIVHFRLSRHVISKSQCLNGKQKEAIRYFSFKI